MRKVMKFQISISTLLLILPSIAEGQAVPTAAVPQNWNGETETDNFPSDDR